ncbi:MAG: hypothetical protein WBO97_02770 [Tepidiformaceae bacterium]
MVRSHCGAILTVLLALVVLNACNSDPVPPIEGVRVDGEFSKSLEREHLTFAASLSRDGWITFDDYESATMAFIGCASSQGATLRASPEISKRRRYFYALETPPGRDLRSEILVCRKQYLDPVEFVWAKFNPVLKQDLAAAEQLMAICLWPTSSAAGEARIPPDPSELRRRECARSVFEKTGLPDYYVWE